MDLNVGTICLIIADETLVRKLIAVSLIAQTTNWD